MESDGDPKRDAVEDVVLLVGRTEDHEGHHVIRKRGERIEAGQMRPAVEGRPLLGDMVRLSPRDGSPNLFDVEVLHEGPKPKPKPSPKPLGAGSGPAQVATESYRTGWEAIWGKKRARSRAN